MICHYCHNTMTHIKDKLMMSHSREIRKRMYRCDCGASAVEVERRYPGESFELHRTDRK